MKVFTKLLVGVVLIIGGTALIATGPRGKIASTKGADANADTHTTWTATKVLTTSYGAWGSRKKLAIGPGEWSVKYQQNDGIGNFSTIYAEKWSLPQMPNCFTDQNACKSTGAQAGLFIWGEAHVNWGWQAWTFTLEDPKLAEFDTCNNCSRAQGSGAIGEPGSATLAMFTTGAYAWSAADMSPGTGDNTVWKIGNMIIPLQWSVDGYFCPNSNTTLCQ